MRKAYFLFGSSFFILATCATLLLTWTGWWMYTIGPSMPARRPFFKPSRFIPSLLQTGSSVNDTDLPVYAYTLQGGWPSFNSSIRLFVSILAVLSSFSFAVLATRLPHVLVRRCFASILFAIIWLAVGAAILDAIAIGRTGTECARSKCTSAVPDIVLLSDTVCICSVEAWFYITLFADLILALSAFICFILTVRPKLAAAVAATPTNHIEKIDPCADMESPESSN